MIPESQTNISDAAANVPYRLVCYVNGDYVECVQDFATAAEMKAFRDGFRWAGGLFGGNTGTADAEELANDPSWDSEWEGREELRERCRRSFVAGAPVR